MLCSADKSCQCCRTEHIWCFFVNTCITHCTSVKTRTSRYSLMDLIAHSVVLVCNTAIRMQYNITLSQRDSGRRHNNDVLLLRNLLTATATTLGLHIFQLQTMHSLQIYYLLSSLQILLFFTSICKMPVYLYKIKPLFFLPKIV